MAQELKNAAKEATNADMKPMVTMPFMPAGKTNFTIAPKAGEWGMIGGFIIGMVRLLTNIFTNTGKDLMTGWYWEHTAWFWQTNWLIFEVWLLVFILLMMVVVSFFTPKPTAQQIESITFTGEYRKQIAKSWNWVDIAASAGVALFCVLFYIYFW